MENILEGLIIARKIPKEEAVKRAEAALEKVGLLAYKDYYPSQLSGGQQQRIGIARAIACETRGHFIRWSQRQPWIQSW